MSIKEKILNGDFSDLLYSRNEKNYAHPSNIAKIFTEIPFDYALQAFQALSASDQSIVFTYLDNFLQKNILKSISPKRQGRILNELSSDDRIIFFSSLKSLEQTHFINLLNEKNKDDLQTALGYSKNSVARIMNTDVATVHQEVTIADAIEHLKNNHKDDETANVIYVVATNNTLIDDIPVRRLVLNDTDKKVTDILDGFCPSLTITETKEDAVEKFKQYDRVVLPVVNAENILLGVVTIDDILDVEEQANTREIQKIGGVEELDYPYVETPFFELLKKRASWLVILFLGEMLTATAMGYFDGEIEKAVVLALFVPLIISSGGNSGSQAATLIIRAMALKEIRLKDWWYVMRREILSGLSLGVVLGTIGLIRIAVWQNLHWYDYGQHWFLLAVTIFFSLIGIVMWGTFSGSMIPIVLKKCKIDPATSSAPFVATLVDVTGLIIYFSIASIILKGTIL
ncbi:magnesium transporter [Chryseobacterium sp. C3]|uniref:magnesium transporter n=1 Tax=Chryseobacterium sp. C3 TaxID=2761532 RepID=UPI001628E90E|nr:magnesium transporter [Chryseobacterium sp. C3]